MSAHNTILLYGTGRLAQSLARSFGESVVGVIGRDQERVSQIIALTDHATAFQTLPLPDDQSFDTLWLAISDRAISQVVSELAHLRKDWNGITVIHSSGATPLDVLEPLRERGAHTIVLHPNVSLTGALPVPSGIVWSLSSDPESAGEVAENLLSRLNPFIIRIREEMRPLYHAAASVAANYAVSLFFMAKALYVQSGAEPEVAARIVHQFMGAVVESCFGAELIGDVLTGPVIRGDEDIVRLQTEAVQGLAPQYAAAFKALTDVTRQLIEPVGGNLL